MSSFMSTARMKSQTRDLEPHTSRQIIAGHDFEVRWVGLVAFRFRLDGVELSETAFDVALRLATETVKG